MIPAESYSSAVSRLRRPFFGKTGDLFYALASVASRRRQKKYESPQSTPVAGAQPHASGP
jgi:hypothetical protein